MLNNNLNIFWDLIADNYPDEISILYSAKKLFDRSLINVPSKPLLLLDAACGNGNDLIYFNNLGFKVFGFDFSARMCFLAKRHMEKYGLNDKIQIKYGDLRKIPFDDNYFDYVVCFSSIDHIPALKDRQVAFQELNRVVKPQGRVIVTVPNVKSLLGTLINSVINGKNASYFLHFRPRIKFGIEYAEIIDKKIAIQEGQPFKYQWEHYFNEEEIITISNKAGLKVLETSTNVFNDPFIAFNYNQRNRFLINEQNKSLLKRRGILSIKILSKDIDNQLKFKIKEWKKIPSKLRGFRLALIATKER